jgi:hypothetical protein
MMTGIRPDRLSRGQRFDGAGSSNLTIWIKTEKPLLLLHIGGYIATLLSLCLSVT